MNSVLLIAKGIKYIDILLDKYPSIKGRANYTIYTDIPEKFKHVQEDIRFYDKDPFRYFDKYTITYLLTKEKKKPIMFCDVGRLDIDGYINLFNFDSSKINSIYTNSNWQGVFSSKDLIDYKSLYFEKGYWNNIVEHFQSTGVDPKKVVPYLERLFIFPYESWVSNVVQEIENIREIFENNSKTKKHVYPGIGNGEGLALGYALSKTKNSHKLLRDIPILTKQPYILI